MPRERREQLILDVAGAGLRRAAATSRASMDEIADAGRRVQADAVRVLRLQGGAVPRLHRAHRRRAARSAWWRADGAATARRARCCGRGSPSSWRSSRSTATAGRCCSASSASTRPFAEQVAAAARADRRRRSAGCSRRRRARGRATRRRRPRRSPTRSSAPASRWPTGGSSTPRSPRDEVADWYYAVVQAVLAGPGRAVQPRLARGRAAARGRPSGDSVRSPTLRTASSTPGMNDSRSVESWRIVSVWPTSPRMTSWWATSPGRRTEWIGAGCRSRTPPPSAPRSGPRCRSARRPCGRGEAR